MGEGREKKKGRENGRGRSELYGELPTKDSPVEEKRRERRRKGGKGGRGG